MCWRTHWRWLFWLFVPTETKFSTFWNFILDEKKPLFTTEKFLYQANDESRGKHCIYFACFHVKDIKLWPFLLCLQLSSHFWCSVKGSSWTMLTGLTAASPSETYLIKSYPLRKCNRYNDYTSTDYFHYFSELPNSAFLSAGCITLPQWWFFCLGAGV